jgi:CubicO group peptidase (beta-lactamase class C family)
LESGLNATAVDYARFGPVFLHEREWNGRRGYELVLEAWMQLIGAIAEGDRRQ